jgi:hypothetical protein
MCPFTGRGRGYRPNELDQAVRFLETMDVIVGHNITGYDVLALEKFYPNFKCPKVFDTLVLSRMLEPARLMHGLKSYGIQLGTLKGDYGESEEAWDKFTEEMFVYCKGDVELSILVYNYLCEQAGMDKTNPPALAWG